MTLIQVYKDLTIAQIWAAITTVLLVLTMFGKFFKEVLGIEAFGKHVFRGFPIMMKWIYRGATFRKEILTKMDFVVGELKYNGGSSTKDILKAVVLQSNENHSKISKLEQQLEETKIQTEINDICNNRMTFKMNDEGGCTFINEVFLREFGYGEKDILGYGFESVVHEDDVQEMRVKWQRAISQKGRFYDEQRIWDAQRNTHECIVRGFPRLEGDQLVEFLGIIEFKK